MQTINLLLLCLCIGEGYGAQIRLMSYNMYGWNAMGTEAWKKENLFKTIRASNPDLLGTQEIEGHQGETAAAIGSGYSFVDDGFGSHGIIYRTSVLTLEAFGLEKIYEQDQWGQRYVTWAQFRHSSGAMVDHFNTHLCVCDEVTLLKSAQRLAEVVATHRRPGSTALLTGDLNVFGGFENSQAVRFLKGELGGNNNPFEDTFRVADPTGNGETFPGGKIDYILADYGTPVWSSVIDRTTVPYGQASDHFSISAVIEV